MSRYLTAAKVAYLALIHLYCDDGVPDSGVLDFLSCLVSLTSGNSAQEEEWSDGPSGAPLTVSTISDLEGHAALKLASTVPGRAIYEQLIKRLWEVDSLDALHEFINTSDALFSAPEPDQPQADESFSSSRPTRTIILGQRSPLGIFIRRVKLEFTRLQFSDAVQLWLSFVRFKEPSKDEWVRQSRQTGSFDRVVQELELNSESELFRIAYESIHTDLDETSTASANDVEKVLEFQLAKMQRFGSRVPTEIRSQLQDMTSKLRSTPSLTYFLQFFDAWRAGDYHTSFDCLHRYFDHSLQARDKTHYQYALLHMAILHADFGCFSEAVAAMNEAIATARENQDIACLNFSLNWLNHLRKAHPKEMRKAGWPAALGESEKDGLLFLKSRARDMKMWSLLSSALLGEARLDILGGESVSRVLEHVYQSSHVLTQHCLPQNAGSQLAIQSAIYSRIGCDALSSAYNNLLSQCYDTLVPGDDIVSAACRTATALAAGGAYDEAAALLQATQSTTARGVLKTQQRLHTHLHLLTLRRAIYQSDHATARLAIAALKPLASTDPEVSFEFQTLRLRQEVRLGNYDNASSILKMLAEDAKAEDADIYHRLAVTLLKAKMFAHAGTPVKGFTMALKVASAAQRVGIMPLLWQAVELLAEALIELEEFEAAGAIVDAVLPAALEGGDAELLGALYERLGDAMVGSMGQKRGKDNEEERFPGMTKAALFLERAEQFYLRIEDRIAAIGVTGKKAVLAQLRGDVDMANSLARKVAEFDIEAG